MSNEVLNAFFDNCLKLEESYKSYWLDNNDEWNTERILRFSNGVIFGLYIERNNELLSLMNNNYDINELVDLIHKDIDCPSNDIFKTIKELGLDKKFQFTKAYYNSDDNILDWLRNNNPSIYHLLENEDEKRIVSILYIHYRYLNYRKQIYYNRDEDQSLIQKYYSDEKDKNFIKWGLLPVNKDKIKLMPYTPPRLFDYNKSLTLFVDLPEAFVKLIVKLINEKLIKECAVRCKNSGVYNGLFSKQYICHALERGRLFSLNILSLPDITKMCDLSFYNDQLWIKKSDSEIIFEELYDDFIVEDDSVVTKMIHLNYCNNIITHIDYELIFYSVDEYEKRLTDMNVHGHGKKRRKYFKIDNASIPFDYPCNAIKFINNVYIQVFVPFIYFVLNCFFTRHELIDEYFSSVLK